jgi:hypothetical protein
LGKEVTQIYNEILEHAQIVQRIDGGRLCCFSNGSRTGEPVHSVDVHSTGAADTFATGAAERERRIDLVLDLDQRVENHGSTPIEIDLECVYARVPARIRIIPIYLERFHACSPRRGWPDSPDFDPGLRGNAEVSRNRKSFQHGDAGLLIRRSDGHETLSKAAIAVTLSPAGDW